MTNTNNTSHKIALVTGAGSGIGKVTALGLLEDGWHVIVTGRRHEPLAEVVNRISVQGMSERAVSTTRRTLLLMLEQDRKSVV